MTIKEKIKFLEELDILYFLELKNVQEEIKQGLIKQYNKNQNPYN